MNRQQLLAAIRERPFDWLLMLLASWLIPLGLLGKWGVAYIWSLTLWLAPIIVLFGRFWSITRDKPRVRRAFKWTVVYIFLGGCFLDIVFGVSILCFDCGHHTYIWRLPTWAGSIPIEEILFYFLGAYAVLLLYFWADHYWLAAYHVPETEARGDDKPLLRLSFDMLSIAVALFAVGVVLKKFVFDTGWIPTYFTFLDVVAFAPALAIYRKVKRFVNWRAFSFVSLYTIVTACVWEVTLALPRRWWGYQHNAMLGPVIEPWSNGPTTVPSCPLRCNATFGEFPVEALLVWLAVTFAAVIVFEAFKVYHHDQRPPRIKLLG